MYKIESCSEKDSGDNFDNKKKTFTEKLSERLKDIMGEKGVDITRLSEAIGVSKSTISRYLKGMRKERNFLPACLFPSASDFCLSISIKAVTRSVTANCIFRNPFFTIGRTEIACRRQKTFIKWRNFSIVPWISSWAEATELFEGYIEPCAPAHGVFGILFFETLTFW